jgi:hypothetical protein
MIGRHWRHMVMATIVIAGLAMGTAVTSAQQGGNGNKKDDDSYLQQQIDALKHQISTLANQVASLLASSAPLHLVVNCGSGESVASALAQAQGHAGAVNITIAGTGIEEIAIRRDDVTLHGASPSDGFQAPPGTQAVITIKGLRTSLNNLTITGGQVGVDLTLGSLGANNITISGTSQSGIQITANATLISNSTFDSNQNMGVTVGAGGRAHFVNSDVSHNGFMGVVVRGGGIELEGTTVNSNAVEGIQSWLGGTVSLSGATLQGNTFAGLDLNSNSSAMIDQGTLIAGNGGSGVTINSGSVAGVGGATISGNNGGILVYGGSMLQLGGGTGVTIQSNASDGVSIWDTGVLVAAMGVQITQNTGWGVFCAGPPAVAQIGQRGPSALTASTVFSNGAGQINCPGNHVP